MDIKFDQMKELMKEKRYIATDELVWDTIKGIKKIMKGQEGQKLYSICLEGPPGAGKTFYAETYKKVLESIFNEEVDFLQYQCDSTTGKSELYEEIRVAAAITGNADEVIIAGMLVEAMDKVNEGKKVVLCLDEFEKSRRETDSFMYQFLQEGKIKTTQRGIVEIKPEYSKNLQVILCKNDERELADPLLRRNRIIRLDVMTPKNFIETVNMNLPECDEDIKNIVTLLYEKMYDKKEDFAKFPSCSEGMLAIQDACDLLDEEASADVIYADILSNLLKHPDDIETFKLMFKKDKSLNNFVTNLQKIKKENNSSAKDEIYRAFFSKEIQKLSGMEQRYEQEAKRNKNLIESLKKQINDLKNSGAKENTNNEAKQKDVKDTGVNNDSKNLINNYTNGMESLDGDIVYVPANIVGKDGSVFDGSENWYEIMRFYVTEDGWESFEECAVDIEKYRDILIKRGWIVKEKEFTKFKENIKEHNKTRDDCLCFLYNESDEDIENKFLLKNLLCFDGIILQKSDSFNLTIVAQKRTSNGENWYSILSNKAVQNQRMFFLDLEARHNRNNNLGINGLREVLLYTNNVLTSIKENYLLFSSALMERIKEEKNKIEGTEDPMLDGKVEILPEILPGLYKIEKIVPVDKVRNTINDSCTNSWHIELDKTLEAKIEDCYEILLSQENFTGIQKEFQAKQEKIESEKNKKEWDTMMSILSKDTDER